MPRYQVAPTVSTAKHTRRKALMVQPPCTTRCGCSSMHWLQRAGPTSGRTNGGAPGTCGFPVQGRCPTLTLRLRGRLRCGAHQRTLNSGMARPHSTRHGTRGGDLWPAWYWAVARVPIQWEADCVHNTVGPHCFLGCDARFNFIDELVETVVLPRREVVVKPPTQWRAARPMCQWRHTRWRDVAKLAGSRGRYITQRAGRTLHTQAAASHTCPQHSPLLATGLPDVVREAVAPAKVQCGHRHDAVQPMRRGQLFRDVRTGCLRRGSLADVFEGAVVGGHARGCAFGSPYVHGTNREFSVILGQRRHRHEVGVLKDARGEPFTQGQLEAEVHELAAVEGPVLIFADAIVGGVGDDEEDLEPLQRQAFEEERQVAVQTTHEVRNFVRTRNDDRHLTTVLSCPNRSRHFRACRRARIPGASTSADLASGAMGTGTHCLRPHPMLGTTAHSAHPRRLRIRLCETFFPHGAEVHIPFRLAVVRVFTAWRLTQGKRRANRRAKHRLPTGAPARPPTALLGRPVVGACPTRSLAGTLLAGTLLTASLLGS